MYKDTNISKQNIVYKDLWEVSKVKCLGSSSIPSKCSFKKGVYFYLPMQFQLYQYILKYYLTNISS